MLSGGHDTSFAFLPKGRDAKTRAWVRRGPIRQPARRAPGAEPRIEARRDAAAEPLLDRLPNQDGGLALGALTPLNRAAIPGARPRGDDQDDLGLDPSSEEGLAPMARRKAEIRELLLTRTLAEWIERLHATGAQASPAGFPEQLPDDPQAGLHYDVA